MAARTTTAKAAPKPATKQPAKGTAQTAASKPARKGATPTPAVEAVAEAPASKAATKPAAAATVTLKHLSAELAERHGMEKKQAEAIVTGVFENVIGHLRSGDRVRIGGFGVLEVKDRPARMGRNPATGEAVEIAASRKLAFRIAKDLKGTI